MVLKMRRRRVELHAHFTCKFPKVLRDLLLYQFELITLVYYSLSTLIRSFVGFRKRIFLEFGQENSASGNQFLIVTSCDKPLTKNYRQVRPIGLSSKLIAVLFEKPWCLSHSNKLFRTWFVKFEILNITNFCYPLQCFGDTKVAHSQNSQARKRIHQKINFRRSAGQLQIFLPFLHKIKDVDCRPHGCSWCVNFELNHWACGGAAFVERTLPKRQIGSKRILWSPSSFRPPSFWGTAIEVFTEVWNSLKKLEQVTHLSSVFWLPWTFEKFFLDALLLDSMERQHTCWDLASTVGL